MVLLRVGGCRGRCLVTGERDTRVPGCELHGKGEPAPWAEQDREGESNKDRFLERVSIDF